MKRIAVVLGVIFIVAGSTASAADLFFSDVQLRPDVTADIHVLVIEKPKKKCKGESLFAVHGLANTANTWKPLAEELFDDNPIGKKIDCMLAIDLPGRGESSLPRGLSFGQLTLFDHAQAVIVTLERLRDIKFRPKTIMGHSQGGLIVQMVQQALIDAGSSLKKKFKIKKAFLLASVAPAAVPWFLADSDVGEELIEQFIRFNKDLGIHVAVSDYAWPFLFFTTDLTDQDTLVPNAPSREEVTAEAYNSAEPFFASLQLVGAEPSQRPHVDRGIFHKTGTKLELVAMGFDSFLRVKEQIILYNYLANDYRFEKFALVIRPDAVHSMYISNPWGMLESLVSSNVSLP